MVPVGVAMEAKKWSEDNYGKTLKKTSNLKSNACLAPSQPIPAFVLKALQKIHPEVTPKYYGCGLVVPECLEDCKLLDLGSGSGRDCYMLSQLVGEKGHVTGIDMTEDQVHNLLFRSWEHICFSPDKRKVLSDAYRLLKDGGELYFSDVYSSRKLSDEIKNHKVLWECLGGALWWGDQVRLAQEVGFSPPRLVTANVITVDNMELEAILGDYQFVSATYRLFKVPKISNKGSLVIYNGNITGFGESLEFDAQYTFKVDEVVEVDGKVASILSHSRFAEGFTFQPPGVPAGCGVKKPKVGTVNPFELVLQLGSATVSSATGGCCGAESSCCK
ncbi:arsenite methyltransferase-like [Oncorhynchus clarkii lewisi]|uniref:arsenite methyltransferase-like n=1 Tax=Oncorhynchus clarkii lewisi TaxID=490388 RepID=UPI0039B8EBED